LQSTYLTYEQRGTPCGYVIDREAHMTDLQTARLAADIDAGVDARLRLLALVRRQRRIGRLLSEVLDSALPTHEELARLVGQAGASGDDAK
jgi:hypothetical protein